MKISFYLCVIDYMRIWSFIFIIILALGCQKPKNVILNDEEHLFTVDEKGNIYDPLQEEINSKKIEKKSTANISFQSNQVVINFYNGSSLILKPVENTCEEWSTEKTSDPCLEEYLVAAMCKDEENSTIICSNDSIYWEFNIHITQNKEGMDSTQLKIKKLKNYKKSSQDKMALEHSSPQSLF